MLCFGSGLHDVRKKLLQNAYVAAIGPQNAGKTTALTKIFPGLLDLPNKDTISIGMSKHTLDVTTYEFDNLTIVDFPGFNTITESGQDKSVSKKIRTSMTLCC